MNKIQKIVAKIFKIKTVVNTASYNDPSKCDSYSNNDSKEMVLKIVSEHLRVAKDGSAISIGVNIRAKEIKSLPLSASLSGYLAAQKNKTEIVIVIDDK